jgi:hypothetical protein
MRINILYKAEYQPHEFPLLFKEGWTGKLISINFETLIARTGWLTPEPTTPAGKKLCNMLVMSIPATPPSKRRGNFG